MTGDSFNRRGDSLGGATLKAEQDQTALIVSIAGAILWGEQPSPLTCPVGAFTSFNRRGDSLGGATRLDEAIPFGVAGFNRRGDSLGGATEGAMVKATLVNLVSIAGAILWGEQRVRGE